MSLKKLKKNGIQKGSLKLKGVSLEKKGLFTKKI
jgi:hypothetical protein